MSPCQLEKAEIRLASLRSISEKLDLGNELTVTKYAQKIASLREQLSVYNQVLSSIDNVKISIESMEQEVGDLTEQMLLGVGDKYGKNSGEYSMAGGKRKVDRKKPVRSSANSTVAMTAAIV